MCICIVVSVCLYVWVCVSGWVGVGGWVCGSFDGVTCHFGISSEPVIDKVIETQLHRRRDPRNERARGLLLLADSLSFP